jgi:hypothetical protein
MSARQKSPESQKELFKKRIKEYKKAGGWKTSILQVKLRLCFFF